MHYQGKTFFQRPDQVPDPLYVITPIFNQIRWRSRWKLFEDFARHCLKAGAQLYVIEAAFGDRNFALGDHDGLDGPVKFIRVRTKDELWLKENMINVAVQQLPANWKYVAWVDADVAFTRPDWANETVHQLQHYKFVQMYSNFQDLTSDYELIGGSQSFMDFYVNGPNKKMGTHGNYYYPGLGYPGVPGLAWAATRDAWDAVGGLIDWTIVGSGDWYMAHALVNRLEDVIRKGYHDNYVSKMLEWQARCERSIRRNVGIVQGLAIHHWHGHKQHRQYQTRDQILINCKFDPELDLKRDWQGLYQLSDQNTERSIKLRDQLRKYFRTRNEDEP